MRVSVFVAGLFAGYVNFNKVLVMNEASELQDKVKALEVEVSEVKNRLNEARQELALEHCPFYIGDIVVSDAGTMNFDRATVEEIRPKSYRPYYSLYLKGFKNNGEPYKLANEAWNPEFWSKEVN